MNCTNTISYQCSINSLITLQYLVNFFLQILLQESNLGIRYQYNIPVNGSENGTEYVWQYTPWSECSVSCARGISKVVAVCVSKEDQAVVANTYCVPHFRPSDKHKYCNEEPCNAE